MSKEKQEIIFYLFIPLPLIPPPLASPLRNRIPEGGASPPARSRRVPGAWHTWHVDCGHTWAAHP